MDHTQKLESLRREIRDVTGEILRLAGRRFALAKEVERVKSALNMEIEDPKIESNLKREVVAACVELGVERSFCLKLMNLIINESVRIQKKQRDVIRRIHQDVSKEDKRLEEAKPRR